MIRNWLIDTNVLISALLSKNSKAAEAVLLARKTGTLIISAEIVQEYSRLVANILEKRDFNFLTYPPNCGWEQCI